MIEIEIDAVKLKQLIKATERAGRKFSTEFAGAINATAKKTRLEIGKQVRTVVAIKKKESEAPIKVRSTATATSLQAVVSLKKTRRLGLQHFGASQNNSGVSYKISKRGGRKKVRSAFMGPKPGQLAPMLYGGVWKRQGEKVAAKKGRYQGKMRQPIIKLNGVSAYGAFVKNNLTRPQVKAIQAELAKQMERRIRLNILRAEGLVNK